MINPLTTLLRAFLPFDPGSPGFCVTQPGPGVGADSDEDALTEEDFATTGSRHDLVNEHEMYAIPEPRKDLKPYADKARYHVVWYTSDGKILVAHNALSPTIPPMPTENGPIGCGCVNEFGQPRFFGPTQPVRHWCPDFYVDNSSAPFTPDMFHGHGPCAKRPSTSALTTWTPGRLVQRNGEVHFIDAVKTVLEEHHRVDWNVAQYLGLEFLDSPCPLSAPDETALWRLWSDWTESVIMRRREYMERLVGRSEWYELKEQDSALFARMYYSDYFIYGAVGAWFAQPAQYIPLIDFLLGYGIPVFYEWTNELEADPKVSHLRPAPRPLASLPRTPARGSSAATTPSTPSRGAEARPSSTPPATPVGAASSVQPSSTPGQNTSLAPGPVESVTPHKEVRFVSGGTATAPTEASTPSASRLVNRLSPRVPSAATDYEAPPAPALLLRMSSPRVPALQGRITASASKSEPWLSRVKGSQKEVALQLVAPERRPAAATPSLLLRMGIEFALPGEEDEPRVIIYDNGWALAVIKQASTEGWINSPEDFIRIALMNGIRFSTGILVKKPNPGVTNGLRAVFEQNLRVDRSMGYAKAYEVWGRGVSHILATREHVYRAARLRGGILARIATELHEDHDFPIAPLPAVYEYGSYEPIVLDGKEYHDDWLSRDEECLFIGMDASSMVLLPRSLWPPAHIWDKYSNGLWNEGHELWFMERRKALRTGRDNGRGVQLFLTAHAWDEWLRARQNQFRVSSWKCWA